MKQPDPSHPGPNGAVVVCSCGHENPAGTQLCARPGCRRLLKGNGLGRYVFSPPVFAPVLRAIEDEGRTLVEQSVADAGGRSELSARAYTVHEYRGLLHVRIRKLALALETHGDFDKRGRLRGAWIDRLKGLIETAAGLDKTLGLQRATKRLTPTEYWRQKQEPQS